MGNMNSKFSDAERQLLRARNSQMTVRATWNELRQGGWQPSIFLRQLLFTTPLAVFFGTLADVFITTVFGKIARWHWTAITIAWHLWKVTPLELEMWKNVLPTLEGMPYGPKILTVAVGVSCMQSYWMLLWKACSETITEGLTGNGSLRDIFSKWVWKLKNERGLKPAALRQIFNDTPMLATKEIANHTHGNAAASRSTGVAFMEHYAGAVGLKYYSVQMSASDVRHGQDGDRTFYWAKDLTVAPQVNNATQDHMVCITDVDYYMDMPNLLTTDTANNPICVYTFIPDRVCGQGDNYAFTFNAQNVMDMTVSGGAHYTHQLWNYSQDCVVATRKWLGVPYRATSWLVDKRKVSHERYVILFTPMGGWGFLGAILLSLGLTDMPRLKRLEVAQGEFLRLAIHRPDGRYVSTARVGSHLAATVTEAEDDMCRTLARLAMVKLTVPTLQSVVKEPAKAAVLVDFFREHGTPPKDIVFPVGLGVRRYQVFNARYEPEAKPSLVPFMSPLVHGTFAPDQTRENERYAVEERIVKIQSHVEPNHMLIRFMDEFIERMFPVPGVLRPVGFEEVLEHQARPTQKRLLESAAGMLGIVEGMRMIKSFLKKEAYQGMKPPRVISTINPLDKLEYSQFIYPLADYMKQNCKWYAFGKSPIGVAQAVADLCQAADAVGESDLARMDGRVSAVSREFDRRMYVRAFAQEYRERLLAAQRTQFNLPGRTSKGIKYDSKNSRASGSLETSTSNTNFNSFGNFVAFRRMGLNADQAYAALGIYGGDDGLTANIDPHHAEEAFKMLGQELTSVQVKRGTRGVKFLARQYSPNVWYGDTDSCADIYRQVSKFHVTVSLPPDITPAMKLVEKARGYICSDAKTPVLGLLCEKALELAQPELVQAVDDRAQALEGVRYWHSNVDLEKQYPNNDNALWMQDYAERSLPGFDFGKFWDSLIEAKSVEDLLKLPMCMEIPVPKPVEVVMALDDQVVIPEQKRPTAGKTLTIKKQPKVVDGEKRIINGEKFHYIFNGRPYDTTDPYLGTLYHVNAHSERSCACFQNVGKANVKEYDPARNTAKRAKGQRPSAKARGTKWVKKKPTVAPAVSTASA